ncbi:MAG: serine hydrolase domain-containing protein [Gemmatimonadota bacterium]|nr:serine hydrolase domain-containing protein [Gemmatimonadota bacterium]
MLDRNVPRCAGIGALATAATMSWSLVYAAPTAGQAISRPGDELDIVRIDPALAKKIDFAFERFERAGSPGAALGIVADGELVYARGYGFADLEHRVPITPKTVFHVASVSKQFTALAIGMLAEDGKLSLDDDVRAHVPELPDLGHRITLRHLIHHTSGIRDQWTLLTLAGWRLDDVITRADILGLLTRQRELNFVPGTEYTYSNSGYTLLAEIVDRTTGRSFRDWTAAAIFEPLGMDRTHAHDDHRMIVPDRAESYSRREGGGFQRSPLNYSTVGATSLFTTVEDMAIWGQALLDRKFRPAVLEQMVRPARLSGDRPLDYGFGLGIDEVDGRRVIQHGGADAGFRSHFAVFPDDGVAVVVLANFASINAGQLAHGAADVFLSSRESIDVSDEVSSAPVAGAPAGETQPSSIARVEIDEKDLEPLLGMYWNPVLDNVRTIRLTDGALWYDRGGGNASELVYTGSSVFRMAGVDPPLEVRFERSGASAAATAPDAVVVEQRGEPTLRLTRLGPPRDPIPADDYVGVYLSDEVGVSVRILARDDGIALRHPRHGTIPLRPVAEDRFDSGQWWLGSLRFTRDGDGRVESFRSTSGRVRNLLFARESDGEPSRFRSPPDG